MRPQKRSWQTTDHSTHTQITLSGIDFGGSGPIALLSHANGFCAATWQFVAERLTQHFHVVAMDARGHGDSEARPVPDGYATWEYFIDDLTAVARALVAESGQPRITLGVGSSFGGIITAGAAARSPDLFQRIAMLDPPIHPSPELTGALGLPEIPTTHNKSDLVERTRRRTSVWPSREAALLAWRDKPMFSPWPTEAFNLFIEAAFRDRADGQVELKCSPLLEAHIFESTGSIDILNVIHNLTAPALLVRASRGMFPKTIFDRLIEEFPDGRLQNLDSDHLIPLEAPELAANALLDFAGVR